MLRTLIILAIVFALLLALWLWWARPSGQSDLDAYHAALDAYPGSTTAVEAGVENFRSAFADLTAPDTEQRMLDLYSEGMFFNDTLVTLESNTEVADYMARTGDMLATSRVVVDHELIDGADVFVRWTMHFETSAWGVGVESKTIGMTHLRFDEEGRVVIHQDFWDAASGLYEHLPIVGAMIRTAKRLMK